ncbi:NAD(P)H-dependent oxidoreductase [Virgibacillus sp. AGTR]|uniref:NADPH-dependent FMN reductase n=1 Tax=Virgibacillus sp. AGTR TaxID=2812055 RepID=UPI001D16D478|nr:NAD(P)H-dependent oxidoreductase [Virgibacillus sp. AGTR]MCC2252149.1 NAD(P)H-dependent oxidoreductase [Virgibacillus sp. AGTR]
MLLVCGSVRRNSNTEFVCNHLLNLHQELEYLNLKDLNFPIMGSANDLELNNTIKEVGSYISDHEGIIITTPEYHGGMSGALKNFLDYYSSNEFSDKKVLLIGTAGGGKGGINALNNLRLVLRSLGANVVANQVIFDQKDIDKDLGRVDSDLLKKASEYILTLSGKTLNEIY